jgi:hypothetical protein
MTGFPVWAEVAPGTTATGAAVVELATSMTGSLVIENVADPMLTCAPETAWSPEPVTK